jgi:glutamate-1-semialdehyde 2,1-aminomutase
MKGTNMNNDRSRSFFKESIQVIPGGVNSPVRACKSVGAEPVFIQRADGSKIIDADGNEYIDYIGSWGPMILGHRHPAVLEAVKTVLSRGTSFGAPTDLETDLATIIVNAVPSIEMVRMVNSGTEATMSAVRLARGFTNRNIIVKFDGCYHGHSDTLLVEAGSGVATLGIPGSPGIPDSVIQHTLSLPFNDVDSITRVFNDKGDDIAGVIVEPVAGNMGMVKPAEGFLESLRDLTEKAGSLLIFDEVMTGFRVAYGGAQSLYGIMPDLTCLGKIIGGGLPVGAYGGRKTIMESVAPQGSVYQAGTLSGNPVAMAAGITTLTELQQPGVYETLDTMSQKLAEGLLQAAKNNGIKASAANVGSMLGFFFTDKPVNNFDDAKTSDTAMFSAYYKKMRDKGIYLAPSQFEALFVSAAHSEDDIDKTIRAAEDVLADMV